MRDILLYALIWAVLTTILTNLLMLLVGGVSPGEVFSIKLLWQFISFFLAGIVMYYITRRKERAKKD